MPDDNNKKSRKIFGILQDVRVRLPYGTPEEQAQADKVNEELSKFGMQTYRSATDWGYCSYEQREEWQNKRRDERQTPRFKSGDLIKIFKTVTEGDVLWDGKVSLSRKEYHHGLQRGMDGDAWADLFYAMLPCKVTTKEGRTFFGMTEPFAETGTEGTVWSVMEYGKEGYDALHCLKDGDKLTVYSRVYKGDVEWQGRIKLGPNNVHKLDWTEIMRDTKHVDTRQWLRWTWERRPILVIPK